MTGSVSGIEDLSVWKMQKDGKPTGGLMGRKVRSFSRQKGEELRGKGALLAIDALANSVLESKTPTTQKDKKGQLIELQKLLLDKKFSNNVEITPVLRKVNAALSALAGDKAPIYARYGKIYADEVKEKLSANPKLDVETLLKEQDQKIATSFPDRDDQEQVKASRTRWLHLDIYQGMIESQEKPSPLPEAKQPSQPLAAAKPLSPSRSRVGAGGAVPAGKRPLPIPPPRVSGARLPPGQTEKKKEVVPPGTALPKPPPTGPVAGPPPKVALPDTASIPQEKGSETKADSLIRTLSELSQSESSRLEGEVVKERSFIARHASYLSVGDKDKKEVNDLMAGIKKIVDDRNTPLHKKQELLKSFEEAKKNNAWLKSVLEKSPDVDTSKALQRAVSSQKASEESVLAQAAGLSAEASRVKRKEVFAPTMKQLDADVAGMKSPQDANKLYETLATLAPMAETAQEMAKIKEVFEKLRASPFGNTDASKAERSRALLSVGQMHCLHVNARALPRQFVEKAKNYSLAARSPCPAKKKEGKSVGDAWKELCVDREGKLTEKGKEKLQNTVVVQGPLAEYIDQKGQLSDAFLERRGELERADPSRATKITDGEEPLQVAQLASFVEASGVMFYVPGPLGRRFEILPGDQTQQFLFVNAPNIDFEHSDDGATKYLLKPLPEGFGVIRGDMVARLQTPIQYEAHTTPPKPPACLQKPKKDLSEAEKKEIASYDQECAKFYIGINSKTQSLVIDRVMSVDGAVAKLTAMVEKGASAQEVERELQGLGVQVKGGGVIPLEVLMKMRFETVRTSLGFLESLGQASGKNYTYEVSTPGSFVNSLQPPEGEMKGGQLITRLDLLAVKTLQRAGETFPHLGAVVVNAHEDKDNPKMWSQAFPGKVVEMSSVYEVQTTANVSHLKINTKLTTVDKKPIDFSAAIFTRNPKPDTQVEYVDRLLGGGADEEMHALYTDTIATQGHTAFRAAKKTGVKVQHLRLA